MAALLFIHVVSAVAVVTGLPAFAPDAAACAVCDSDAGIALRAGIFDGNFFRTLVEIAAPFPIVAALLVTIERHLPE